MTWSPSSTGLDSEYAGGGTLGWGGGAVGGPLVGGGGAGRCWRDGAVLGDW